MGDEGETYSSNKAYRAGFFGFFIMCFIVFGILHFQGADAKGAGTALLHAALGAQFFSRYLQIRKNAELKKRQIAYLAAAIGFMLSCIFGLLTLLKVI